MAAGKKLSIRAHRALKKREPQLVEGDKDLLAVHGPTSSQISNQILVDLSTLKKPHSKLLTRKNDIRPFEEVTSLEFLCEKNACPAFVYTSHSKKRPNNLVMGRLFDNHIYDMIEMGISNFEAISSFKGAKKQLGSVPAFIFQGDLWERSSTLGKLREMVLDIFGGRNMTRLSLQGLDHVITLSVSEDEKTVFWRVYAIGLKRSGVKVPKVELEPMGPNFDIKIDRTQFATSDLTKEALRVPQQLRAKLPKNVSNDEIGERHGQIHMERQDFSKLELRKIKALSVEKGKRKEREVPDIETEEIDENYFKKSKKSKKDSMDEDSD